jgi:NDP-sugar pyrophosphorylase family protein
MGEQIKVFPFTGRWIDVGTEEFYHSLVRTIQLGEIDLEDFML